MRLLSFAVGGMTWGRSRAIGSFASPMVNVKELLAYRREDGSPGGRQSVAKCLRKSSAQKGVQPMKGHKEDTEIADAR